MRTILKRGTVLLAVCALTLLAIRAYDSQRGPPLEPWHTFVPDELRAEDIDASGWNAYLRAEDGVFESVRTEVTDRLDAGDRVPVNRYFEGSVVYPPHLAHDWNRSYVLEPAGAPVGAVVLLHGLTDSPYSTRHVAQRYRAAGWVAVAIRLPGHGTVPGALTDVEWEDWRAATRLAVREASRRMGPALPLHLMGYSNGGALALQYALDAIDDPQLARPERVVLISPMIGITRFARFAGGSPAGPPSSPPSRRPPGSACCPSSTRSSTTRFRSTGPARRIA
jgi:acetyl esterase/lipase